MNQCEFWHPVLQTGLVDIEQTDVYLNSQITERFRGYRELMSLLLHGRRRHHGSIDRSQLDSIYRLYDALHHCYNTRAIVDTSKSFKYALLLAMIPEIDLYVVHLVRDSRAAAYSGHRSKVRVVVNGEKRLMEQQSRLGSVVGSMTGWMRTNFYCELLRYSEIPYLRIRYEDLCEKPSDVVGVIGQFVHEDFSDIPFVDDHHVTLADNHSVSGNPVRSVTGLTEIVLDDEWRSSLGRYEKAAISALTSPLLLHYRYF